MIATPPTLDDTTQRTARALPLIALLIASLVFAIWGMDRAVGALVGGSVSVINWVSLRWLTKRIMGARPDQRLALSMLLIMKMGLLMAIVFILVHKLALDPIGLVLGLSTLFIAPLLSAALGMGGSTEPNAADAASEER